MGYGIRGIGSEEGGPISFHAGTALQAGLLPPRGGAVLCATALVDNVKAAQLRAYRMAAAITFDGSQMRHDIGHRAIKL